MATPSAIPTDSKRDTIAQFHRVTRGNRSLWYQLTVLQQPERARACGSGMKANSDRRPVDPPPVVELRIVEGATLEEGKDVTFDYNANFFLYASLEHARTIANGRVSNPAGNNPPILTGVPASGMAYLDRPSEAGYFIFPDLSVRHEGIYRLTFSLFETTKEEQDFDMQPADGDLPPGVDFRMEIKTYPFVVYSAKKFPGLMESTQLSKTVADQGCRVRIRRDVRMRKRDSKSGGGNNNNNNNAGNNGANNALERREEDFGRRRTVTPVAEDPHGIRNRSQSNSSEHRASYSDASRRPSMVDSYPPPPPPPPSYNSAASAPRHLGFGESSGPKYSAPRQYAHQPGLQITPVSANGPYPSAAQSPYTKTDAPYGYASRHLPPSCPSPAPSVNRDLYDRRHSTSTYVPPSPSVYSTEGQYRRDSQASYPSTPAAPLPRMNTESSRGSIKISALVEPMPVIEPQVEPLPELPPVNVGGKRKHESVFAQNTRPLFNGQRQMDPHYGRSHRGYSPDHDQGSYSRADGQISVIQFNKYEY